MPISLIPRKEEKKVIKFQPDKIFWALISTALFLFLIFFGLKIYHTAQSSHLDSIEAEIAKIDREKNLDFEKEIKAKKEKIDKIKPILEAHLKVNNIFKFLEENTFTDVKFSNFSFKAKEKTITIRGVTPSANILINQISVLKQDKENVRSVEVSGISISKEGINFQLKVNFNPALFKF